MKKYTNIEMFRIYSGTAFARLYEQFPLSTRFDVGELIEHCGLATNASARTSHMRLVMETLRWLEETGQIRLNKGPGTYDLTPRSFYELSAVPDREENICHGDRLRELAKEVGSESVAKTLAEIVTQIFGTGIKAAYSFLI